MIKLKIQSSSSSKLVDLKCTVAPFLLYLGAKTGLLSANSLASINFY
jgi:hypothetical protein